MNSLYVALISQVMDHGEESSPRGELTREVRPFVFQLTNPLNRLVTLKGRKLNKAFALVEGLQFVAGISDAWQQRRFNSNIEKWVDQSTGEIEAPYGPLTRKQVDYVVGLLTRDPDSRQAVMSIYHGPSHQREMLNVPCTCTLQFFIRNGVLELTVYMRSNDLWWGTPYDVFQFTLMQELIATALGIPMGTYTHVAGSGHLYEPFFEAANMLVLSEVDTKPQAPILHASLLKQNRRHINAVLDRVGSNQELPSDVPTVYVYHLITLNKYLERKERRGK